MHRNHLKPLDRAFFTRNWQISPKLDLNPAIDAKLVLCLSYVNTNSLTHTRHNTLSKCRERLTFNDIVSERCITSSVRSKGFRGQCREGDQV